MCAAVGHLVLRLTVPFVESLPFWRFMWFSSSAKRLQSRFDCHAVFTLLCKRFTALHAVLFTFVEHSWVRLGRGVSDDVKYKDENKNVCGIIKKATEQFIRQME